ncbi:unnamed protein product [Ectocarpus sp. CCAP 1310/34]|nr:unnamed protein product [Ectocarpus sp. CCAP 1310/34]
MQCLSKRCDPWVTWKQDGEKTDLGVELMGHRLFDDWCEATKHWDARHATTARHAATDSTGLRPLDLPQRNGWWSRGEYGGVSVALGLSAIATASLGCPLVYVGPVIWTAAEEVAKANPGHRPSEEQSDRQRFRVDGLRVLLVNETRVGAATRCVMDHGVIADYPPPLPEIRES